MEAKFYEYYIATFIMRTDQWKMLEFAFHSNNEEIATFCFVSLIKDRVLMKVEKPNAGLLKGEDNPGLYFEHVISKYYLNFEQLPDSFNENEDYDIAKKYKKEVMKLFYQLLDKYNSQHGMFYKNQTSIILNTLIHLDYLQIRDASQLDITIEDFKNGK